MAKSKGISNPAFQRNSSDVKPGFHLAPQVNPFTSIFETPVLDEKISNAIDRLMLEIVTPESASDEERIRKDTIQIKNITAEVKAIEKQGILLVGERLYKAREILGTYKKNDGFSAWLKIAFKHFSTAYNAISYYELYKALPKPDLQNKLKEMPNKAAYTLASRKGDIEQKAEIIEKYADLRADEIITIIQDKFPTALAKERAKSSTTSLVLSIRLNLKKLLSKKKYLGDDDLKAISECRDLLDAILETKFLNVK